MSPHAAESAADIPFKFTYFVQMKFLDNIQVNPDLYVLSEAEKLVGIPTIWSSLDFGIYLAIEVSINC